MTDKRPCIWCDKDTTPKPTPVGGEDWVLPDSYTLGDDLVIHMDCVPDMIRFLKKLKENEARGIR